MVGLSDEGYLHVEGVGVRKGDTWCVWAVRCGYLVHVGSTLWIHGSGAMGDTWGYVWGYTQSGVHSEYRGGMLK